MGAAEENIINTLIESMQATEKKPKAYDTGATITRIEGSTAWVHIPGGVDETPVKLTIDAKVGDEVQVRVSDGQAFLVGNATAPPTDDTAAKEAEQKVTLMTKVVETVKKVAESAARIAGNTNQYFWHTETGTDTGAHITEVPQDEFLADPTNGGGNLLARSNGIALRDGLEELATLQQSGMDINSYDSGGNTVSIAHLGYGQATGETGTTSDYPYYSIGTRNTTNGIGGYSVSEGVYNIASGYASHAEGGSTTASGTYSHAEGTSTTASGGDSHAEGDRTTASGDHSHAEGISTTASEFASHSEGRLTTASGAASHAEGNGSEASGVYSHAQNNGTVAGYSCQTAIGEFNDNGSTNAFEIGNGSADDDRSNAFVVDWDGNVVASGDVTNGSGLSLSLLSGAVIVTYKQIISSSTTISSGSATTTLTVACDAISGYTPILATPRNPGNNAAHFRTLYLDGTDIKVQIGNASASSITVSSAYVNVLYVKDELVGDPSQVISAVQNGSVLSIS